MTHELQHTKRERTLRKKLYEILDEAICSSGIGIEARATLHSILARSSEARRYPQSCLTTVKTTSEGIIHFATQRAEHTLSATSRQQGPTTSKAHPTGRPSPPISPSTRFLSRSAWTPAPAMTRLPPDASEPKAATINSDRPTPAAKNANVADHDDNTNNRRARRGIVQLPQLRPRQAQVQPNSRTTPNANTNATAAPFHQSQSLTNNPEAIHQEHLPFPTTSSRQQQHHHHPQVVHRIGSGVAAAAAAEDGYALHHHHAAASSSASAAAGPPSPPRCSRGQPSWPSPVKFEPEPSRIIKISSDPTLSCGRRIRQRARGDNVNASSWDYDDDEDHEARAEEERMCKFLQDASFLSIPLLFHILSTWCFLY